MRQDEREQGPPWGRPRGGLTPSRRDFERAREDRETLTLGRPWAASFFFASPMRAAKARMRASRRGTTRFRRRRQPIAFHTWDQRPGSPERDVGACLHCKLVPNNCPIHDPIPF